MLDVPAVRVDGRYFGRVLPFLNMYADPDELPDPADRDAGRADGYWIGQRSSFEGAAYTLAGESVAQAEPLRLNGITAIAETADGFYILVTGAESNEPAVWCMLPRGAAATGLQRDTEGPVIMVRTAAWQLEIRHVSRLLRHTKAYQDDQERGLAEALASRPPRPVLLPTVPLAARPSDDERLEVKEGFVARWHQASVTTSLIHPTLARPAALESLLHADWLPLNVLARQYRLCIAGLEPPWPAAPPGAAALPPPVSPSLLALPAPSATRTALAAQLWPVLLDDGQPALDPGERIESTWGSRRATTEKLDVHGEAGLPSPLSTDIADTCRFVLTTDRLVMLSALDDTAAGRLRQGDLSVLTGPVPAGLSGDQTWDALTRVLARRLAAEPAVGAGLHVRWGWLAGVTTLTERLAARTKRTSLFSKAELPSRVVAWLYLDVALPDGTGLRVEIAHGEGPDNADGIEARRRRILELIGTRFEVAPPTVLERQLAYGIARTETSAVTAPGYSIRADS